jgi:hypothetical protein
MHMGCCKISFYFNPGISQRMPTLAVSNRPQRLFGIEALIISTKLGKEDLGANTKRQRGPSTPL